jgi:uncharacterized membrane protein
MTTMTCEHCGATPAVPHTFHYGKSTGSTDFQSTPFSTPTSSGVRTTWTTHYQIAGLDTVALCDRCLTRARLRRTGRLLLREWIGVPLIAFFYVVAVICVVGYGWQGDWAQSMQWLGGTAGITALVAAVIWIVLQSEDFAQRAAVQEHEKRLREQGWDAFWTDKEFSKLSSG